MVARGKGLTTKDQDEGIFGDEKTVLYLIVMVVI